MHLKFFNDVSDGIVASFKGSTAHNSVRSCNIKMNTLRLLNDVESGNYFSIGRNSRSVRYQKTPN